MLSINGIEVGTELFPNNERIMSGLFFDEFDITFLFKFETDMDILKLQMYKKFVDDVYGNFDTTLIMPYVPYSRMDREISGYIFSLKYFCDIVNSLEFDVVKIFDPHSFVTPALLNNCTVIYPELQVNDVLSAEDKRLISENGSPIDYIFFPDLGASKKYNEVLNLDRLGIASFSGHKVRSLSDGKITDYQLIDAPCLKGTNILIVDDLCSKGYTFFLATTTLKNNGAENISLFVSHCENSIYRGELLRHRNKDLVGKIYTTDSILLDWEHNKLERIGGFS